MKRDREPSAEQQNGREKQNKEWSNEEIASTFERIAELLDAQDANEYRVRAYREGAATLRRLPEPAQRLFEREGVDGLRELPNIGESLARSIEQLINNGTIALLNRLQGETRPERILASVTGIGPKLASMIHEKLGIETLAELENAANDGRLAELPGFGRGRVRGVREALVGRLHRRPPSPARANRPPAENQPPISELLEIDREYRQNARRLPKIAPRRFNPTNESWLPVLHVQRGENHYTALYSNTARAHELGMVRDWVVIYCDDHTQSGQWTVVTSQFGPLKGKRIVRGRESECAEYYASQTGRAEAKSTTAS